MTHSLEVVARIVRWPEWWYSKMPPLVAVVAMSSIIRSGDPSATIRASLNLLVVASLLAVFGYMLNSLADIASDERAGKRNPLRGMRRGSASSMCAGLLLIGLLTGFALLDGRVTRSVLVSSYVLAVTYSVSPRFKEWPVTGVFVAAGAQRTLPTVLALLVAAAEMTASTGRGAILFAIATPTWATLVGVRWILMHQLSDHDGDRRAGTRTFVTHYGSLETRGLIGRVVFPAELCALVAMLLPVCLASRYFSALVGVGLFLTALRSHDLRAPTNRAVGVYERAALGDLYEMSLPLGAGMAAAPTWRISILFFLGVLILFRRHIAWYWRGLAKPRLKRAEVLDERQPQISG